MAARHRIAIAGGGIAGLTAALALSRCGVAITVFEQATKLEEVGAGLQISPNAWRVLDGLGLSAELLEASAAPDAIRIRSARDGTTIARMPLGRTAEARWGAPYRVVHRADLQDMLQSALSAASETEIRLGSRVTGFRTSGRRVEVEVAQGARQTFDGLVGADGLWSEVRRQITGDEAPRPSRKVAWRATLAAADLPQKSIDPSETGLWLGRDAHLVHYSVRAGSEINVVAVTTGGWLETGWSAPGDAKEVVSHFGSWPETARAVIAAASTWHKWALTDREPIRRWGDGPVTLAGDAAHPMLPFMAQGAAMGIEDAQVLADMVATDDDLAVAFRRYERRRMDRTARVQRAARNNGDIYHLGGLAARGRDLALSMLGTERLLGRWDWLYGWRG